MCWVRRIFAKKIAFWTKGTKLRIVNEYDAHEFDFVEPDYALVDDRCWHAARQCRHRPIKSGKITTSPVAVATGARKIITAKDRARGVIFDKTGFYTNPRFLDLCNFIHIHKSKYEIVFPPRKIDHFLEGEILFPFDGNSHNYFHFIFDGLINLFHMRQAGCTCQAVLIISSGLSSWQTRLLQLLGEANVVLIDGNEFETLRVDRVTWPTERSLCDLPPSLINSFATKLKKAIIIGQPSAITRLYIKRKYRRRGVENESEVVEFLEAKGFHCIDFEEYSIDDQISMMSNASFIVASHGAGLANIIFAKPNTVLIEFLPEDEHPRSSFWILSRKIGLRYGFVRCCSLDVEGADAYDRPIRVNIERLSSVFDLIPDV